MAGARFTDKDKGLAALLKRAAAMAKGATVTVGVHGTEGAETHGEKLKVAKLTAEEKASLSRDGQRALLAHKKRVELHKQKQRQARKRKLTVADIATIHEYGLGHNPQRSFIRAWVDEAQAEIRKALARVAREVVVKGTYSAETGLDRLGLLFVGKVQNRISNGIQPELSKETIDRKGSSKPLIDTGQLRSSIRHRITVGKGTEGGKDGS